MKQQFVRSPLSIALLLTGLAQAAVAHGQSALSDGGFDSQGGSVADYCYTSRCPSGSWLLTAGTGFAREHNIDWPAPAAVSPQVIAFLQGVQSSLTQNFSVPAAGQYVITLSLASRMDHGSVNGNQRVAAEIDGQRVFDIQLQSGQSFRRYVSSPVQLAAGGGHTVRILGLAGGDVTAFVDSVAVVSARGTTTYSYDARGRLGRVQTSDGANAGAMSTYAHDRANNRTRVTVSQPN